jgi:hypothetical protein
MKYMNNLTMNFKRRSFILLALLLTGGMASAQVVIKGNVYGGGKGTRDDVKHGLVTGNTSVTMNNGTVVQSLYGGGELGSVGDFSDSTSVVYNTGGENVTVYVPTACKPNTGLASVVLNGGKLGYGSKAVMPTPGTDTWEDSYGYVFAGGRGEADSINYPKAIALGVVDRTYLEINGAFITASAYGGCENGILLGNSHVKVKSGQVGVPYWVEGEEPKWDTTSFGDETRWTEVIEAIRTGTVANITEKIAPFHECAAWPFGNEDDEYLAYDIFAGTEGYNPQGGALYASDGNTFFGKVYGGGSGYYPIAPGVWRRSAGRVNGNTLVEIEGGHILTSVFGGNELTDVVGSSTIKMTGGTVGVPQLIADIEQRPLNSHVFGAGLGDMRSRFDKWTNVGSTNVYITGGTVFGSVFGGGEDGHVLGNTVVTVKDSINGSTIASSPLIGTWGYSTYEGNVFGGGRGFSGKDIANGGMGGKATVNIEGGTMLGSVYGGGRLASVGLDLVALNGNLVDDSGFGGYTYVNIKGGTIGNRFGTVDEFGNTVGGNVFGGSKGRLTLLDGTTINPQWQNLGKVKNTYVTINKTTDLVIKGHVYGGGEVGSVEQNALVVIEQGTIGYEASTGNYMGGNVYGGGKGTPIEEKAGLVKGNSYVDMRNGWVTRSIYGGGEFGSVGTFTECYNANQGDHFAGEPMTCEPNTGLASVIVGGGQVGLPQAKMPTPGTDAVDDDFGYIFAGSRGTNDPVAYPKANILAVVDTTYLEIYNANASAPTLINASVYGGCENGLVLHGTKVLITGGQIGNGCKKTNPSDPTTWTWDGVYPEEWWTKAKDTIESGDIDKINAIATRFNECDAWPFGNNGQYLTYDIFANEPGYNSQGGSLSASDGNSFFGNVFGGGSGYYPYAAGLWRRTAGRVYGNTNVEIRGGHILTSVFGAGEISDVMGTSSVKMTGGTVGVPQTVDEITGHPLNSHVFGGGKGDPRTPFNEWTNAQNTNVEIMGGVVFGSVFGGGEDGHVLSNTEVILRDSLSGTEILSSPLVGTWGTTTFDGNVFGGGRGLSINSPTVGGVVGNTNLTMEGGLVLGSVYGGGRMAAVGVNLTTGALYDDDNHGQTNVTVSGGTVGNAYETDANTNGHMVGGNVYGASRGGLLLLDGQTENPAWASMAKVRNTDVNIAQEKDNIPTLIKGNVYGGGEIAQVTKNTDVDMTGGTVGTIQYDWKPSTDHSEGMDTLYHITGGNVYGGGHGNDGKRDAAWVMNNSTVAIGGGQVWFNVYGGGEMASVGQRTITYTNPNDPTSPIVAINPVANTGLASVTVTGGQVGPGPKVETGYNLPVGLNSLDGYVFGGGQGIGNDPMTADDPNGHYFDLCNVNYTNVTVNIPATADVNTNRIWGSVFGGSEDGHVLDSTSVTYVSGLLGTFGTTSYDGNIFGGGRNYSGKNYVAGRVQGNTHIEMEGGQIYGNIYGGGRLALTGIDFARTQLDGNNHGRTMVLVKGGTVGNNTKTNTNPSDPDELLIETFSEHSMGNVYGGGMGNEKGLTAAGRPAASALLVGMVKNTVVEVSEVDSDNPTHIYGIVFGGGEIANVGKYSWEGNGTNIEISEGLAKVKIKGGIIGADRAKMRCDLADPSDPDIFWTKYNDDLGYVYGGGEGIVDDPEKKDANNNDVYPYVSISLDGVTSNQRIIDLMATVNNTEVEVSGGWVKASVFGGAEAGHVMHNTKVTISGGQIGAGDNGTNDLRYTDESVFINPIETPITNSLHGTTHWPYGSNYGGSTHYDPFDLVLLKQGITPSDGKSWFGNVFGGGSGWFPYVKKNAAEEYQCYWNPLSGQVWGNTEVFIDGGHILNNVYGANEFTNVIGSASITMTDGTVGVPRTEEDIMRQPTICYVFGGGCGDPRADFDNNTNVASTDVKIQGGIIYGSVFGGAEDGHVLGNAVTTIGQVDNDATVIGSSGTSGVDGNVFGGGRNYLAKTTTPGRVGGNTIVNIDGGTMLGSIYGGGRLGNVGIDINGDTIAGRDHGYTTVNVGTSTQTNNISIGHEIQNQEDRIGGNVYGGGKGLAGPATSIYPTLGRVKQTLVNIDQQSDKQTFIIGSVFGGGEDGHVLIDTYVNVMDGQIGGTSYNPTNPTLSTDYFHGNVYGGGRGVDTYVDDQGVNQYSPTAGKVEGNTHVMITGGRVCRNVYGGGNLASVGDANEVPDASGYHTGWANVTLTENAYVGVTPNSANRNGMVFGAGKGMAGEAYKDLSMVKNTKVIITGKSKVTTTVYGSGEDGHTRRCTDVLIGDATVNSSTVDGHEVVIGTNGEPGVDGNVYGGGRGLDIDQSTGTYSSTAGITGISTNVLVNDGLVKGSVFGGGRLASVGYEAVLDTLNNGNIDLDKIPADYGMATVHITGNAKIGAGTYDNGHVFGSGRGNIGDDFKDLAYVHWTNVTVDGNAQVYGSVFGGGMDGHVKKYTPKGHTDVTKFGDTHVTIGALTPGTDVCNIATDATTSLYKGNVYGGGRGFDVDPTGTHSPTAGRVEGNTKVDILSGHVWRNVFGGGNQAVVMGRKVVNIVNGEVHEDVHGGSNAIPVPDDPDLAVLWTHSGLKTVNVRGGHIHGTVYGCSHSSNDGEIEQSQANAEKWTSFVNVSGGQIDDDVHGAGYAGLVNGSVCVNIGANAILSAPNKESNIDYNKAHTGSWNQTGIDPVEPTADTLVIGGSVYGGSDYYGSTTTNDWRHYDQTGYSLIFIDGTDYNTTGNTDNYMTINGGLYGSGTHTESGALGRHILLRNYGTRSERSGEMTSATRTLTTIQRVNNLVIDHANVNLSGSADIIISNPSSTDEKYGVLRVSDTLAIINASSIVLGSTDQPVYMDSIYTVQSLNLANSSASIYDHNLYELKKNAWYWLGIQGDQSNGHLYNINGTTLTGSALALDKENVMIFNDRSKLWVRYHEKKSGDATVMQYYGELLGFFRMRGVSYNPQTDDETESFAYARPKFKDDAQFVTDNLSDGGFLSYNTTFNYFTDEGNSYTNTEQYPYINVLDYSSKVDRKDYRVWVDPQRKNRWYVDGTRGWGRDEVSKLAGAGRFPDKPKRTLFGKNNSNEGTGIVSETYGTGNANQNYSYKNDLIFVVGALTEFDGAILTDSLSSDNKHEYPLRLYRYPGGHTMSNGLVDKGNGTAPGSDAPFGVQGTDNYAGPGANYGALLDVAAGRSITLKGVVMDGLYSYDSEEATLYGIPGSDTDHAYVPTSVEKPLVITGANSTLTLSDSTVLMRGYNNTNAEPWYTNSDYKPYNADGVLAYHGGALFVDSLATVNVRDTVIITGNKQYLMIGDATATTIESNVYLPTFASHVNISGTLDNDSKIGITNPNRNQETIYVYNTFSPVAVANSGTAANDPTIAELAYTNNNFRDDMDMFFVNNYTEENKRSTYYSANIPDYPGYIEEEETRAIDPAKTLFFGWTWDNVVRTAPDGFGFTTINSAEDLVWLSSLVSSGESISNVTQTDDIDLQQYVWVPAGTAANAFSKNFDGQGHLIKNLSIDYIGTGDRRYERTLYGLFGNVDGGNIDRTFVVSGIIRPVGTATIGGLAGLLNTATLTNSEAALRIVCPDMTGVVLDGYRYAGGLVGEAQASTIHSSMAMPEMECTGTYDYIGGLVGGSATTGDKSTVLNSFANAKFTLGDDLRGAGGLVGYCANMNVENCYIHLYDNGNLYDSGATTGKKFGQLAADGASSTIVRCYGFADGASEYQPIYTDGVITPTNCGWYNAVSTSDTYGYMYSDNLVTTTAGTQPLFQKLNDYVEGYTGSNALSSWARPTLSEINGDLPVLLLNDNDGSNAHQGSFRSLATYDVANGGRALQYGGTVRDGEGKELSIMLGRSEDVFVYGDVNEDLSQTSVSVNAIKVAIHEDAAIIQPGKLGNYDNNYVGITFDNTSRQALDYLGNTLGRDWHMMSSPLKNAPLGVDYQGQNIADGPQYNYWAGDVLPVFNFFPASTNDGYFPSIVSSSKGYAYEYDFYTWYEPDWQWINFKRNGPSHYHEDNYGNHAHIDYYYDNNTSNSAIVNVNEPTFVQGKGYMMAIEDDTYMQSHGQLNNGEVSILVTNKADSDYAVIGGKGCNLIGNPYQAYLDFDRWNATNTSISGYAVYDAMLENGEGTIVGGYRYYTVGSSENPDALASQYLHPHQGFFVKTDDEEETINFNLTSSMIASRTGVTSDFRDDPVNYPLVNIFADDDEGRTDILVVEFNRPENGGGPKIKALRNGKHMIYSHFEDEDYATFFAEKGTKRVPVRFKTFEEDAFYTLRWKTYNGTFRSMYLVDNIMGVRYDMLMSNSYRFESSKEDYLSRFYIEFDIDDTGIDELEPEGDAPFAFFDGTQWVVNGQGFLQLFDVTGRVLFAEEVRGEQNRQDFHGLAKGVYLLRLTDHQSIKVQKIILK